jgi:IS5 family transposase
MTNVRNEKTERILLQTESEIFEKIVGEDHPFRRLNALLDFGSLLKPLASKYSPIGAVGLPIESGFKALLIQFWEDYSDREMEKCLRENLAVRWFCGFGLMDETPDHSYFGKFRNRIGTQSLADLFKNINEEMERRGLFGNVFAFIDASAIITKTALWEERDQALADGEKKLNNKNVKDYAADPDARWGAKGKNKIWFGYKRHHHVDMRFGLIKQVAVTPANVLDYKALKNICPKQGMAFMDKMYDCAKARLVLRENGCASGTIQKNNNKKKNRDLDGWRSKRRMPFEGNFSKLDHRARYRRRVKVLFQCFAEAICHNLKKALTVLPVLIPTAS